MTERPYVPQLKVGATGFVVLEEDEGAIIATELVYRPDDCLAVRLVLLGPDGLEVGWTFAWELLAMGLMFPAGDGDITVRPGRGPIAGVEVSFVALSTARVWLPEDSVAEFVRKVRGRVGLDACGIAPALDKELATITNGTQAAALSTPDRRALASNLLHPGFVGYGLRRHGDDTSPAPGAS